MDQQNVPSGGPHPLQGPHWRAGHGGEAPPDFVPLRLVLQPSGLVIELTQAEVLLGRHSGADVRLPLPDVSRRHCRFVWEGGQWRLYDLNSLNGVYVNDEKVPQATLHHDDQVRIGGFTFRMDTQTRAPTVHLSPEELGREGVLRSIADALPPSGTGSSHRKRLAG
jgi:pSer/pThr/pTyr-binding forkhead associated (FHA) protein